MARARSMTLLWITATLSCHLYLGPEGLDDKDFSIFKIKSSNLGTNNHTHFELKVKKMQVERKNICSYNKNISSIYFTWFNNILNLLIPYNK